jgi:GT2 family glycosyltransferase
MTLTIIILSYNTKHLLDQTLASIPSNKAWQTVVVDNGSTDGSSALVKAKYKKVTLIQNSQNAGFAKANNQAIASTTSKYVMLLNSDVILSEDITPLINYLDKHTQVAAISPKVVLPTGDIDWACHRGMPTPWNAFTYFSGLERLLPRHKLFSGYHQKYLDMNTPHQVEATAATSLIVRRAVIDQVGFLDERFFFYAEDLDWCYRFNAAGWQIIYYPLMTVTHYKSQSGKKNTEDATKKKESTIAFYDTMKQFYQKHYLNKYPRWITSLVFTAIDLKKWWATR